MSSRPLAVDVRGLSKEYRIRHNAPKSTNMIEALTAGWHRFRRTSDESFWGLRDASFQGQPGEVVGCVVHNGAGKSTLLKVLSLIVEPTSGEAFLRGRLG